MSFPQILLIALGLAMDAFAVSIAFGVSSKRFRIRDMFKFGLYFGSAQFIMPLLGWALASSFLESIRKFDHWVAFILLTLIGGKMLHEAVFEKNGEETGVNASVFSMLTLAVATSIDALAVGVSLSLLDTDMLFTSIVIGVTTFVLAALGVYFGKKLGLLFRKKAEIAGGAALVLIGAKILLERLFFS